MSFSVEKLQNYPLIAGLAAGISSILVFRLYYSQNWGITIFITLVVGGFVYLILNDIEQRRKIEDVIVQKEESVKIKIENQRETDMMKENCVSCNKPVKDQRSPCPSCGFKLGKIIDDES